MIPLISRGAILMGISNKDSEKSDSDKGPLKKDPSNLNSDDYVELAKRLELEEKKIKNDDLIEVVNKIASVSPNAKTILRKFNIVEEEGIFEHVESDQSYLPADPTKSFLINSRFIYDFLTSKELNNSIDGLNTGDGFSGWHWNKDHENQTNEDRDLESYEPLFVDGYIARLMIKGGAYGSFEGTHAEAKEWGRQFEDQIFDGKYEDFFIKSTELQWSEWFRGTNCWDDTLIIINSKKKNIWVFMFTATD